MKKCGLLSVLAMLGVFFVFSGVVCADLNDGLVAYYPFNGNADDESENGGNDSGLDDIVFIEPALSSASGASTWSQTGGPENGKIANIIIDPTNSNVIIAGTIGDGVYKTTDQGATWQHINSGLPGDSDTYLVSMDPINSSILYVGTVGGGIFKSTDGGESWKSINTGLTNLNVHMAPAIDPTDTSVLYVGTEGSVFKSTNGGESWSESNNGLTEEYEVCAIAVDPSNSSIVYAGMYYDGYTEGGIFKSTDAGKNWLSSSIGLSTEALKVNSLTIDPEDNQTIYVTADSGVIKSVNGGESWKFINNGLTNQEVYGLAISPLNSEIILVGTWGGGVFHTVNGGETWVSDNNGLFNLTVIGIAFDTLNPTTLYAGTYEDGVFKRSYSYIGPALPSVEETTQYLVTEIYIATFGRAPAYAGLTYWTNAVDTGSFTIEQVAQSFFDQPETQAKFPEDSSNSEFITTIYYNVLNRAPAESGLTYWVDALDSGTMRRDQAIMAIINGAKAETGSSEDSAMLTKKTEIGLLFAHSDVGNMTNNDSFMAWAIDIITQATESDFNIEEAEDYILGLY